MKIVALIARILLGLAFLASGIIKFLPFIPQGPLPPGTGGQFMGALMTSHYILVVGAFETAGGLLLLIGRYVPLALCFLAPVIVNIFFTGVLLARAALLPGIILAILWILVFIRVRSAFAGIFQARTAA
jgi:uncharacterized membrane protein YphA (DoxX/SURF4 family)